MTTLDASILWTLGAVAALWAALRLRARPWIAFLLWLVPTLLLVLDFDRQTLSAHGLLHASIVYDILERGAPPGHPLLGGETLRYPWLHHGLAAAAARLLGVTPAAVFGATGLLSLALFGLALDRAAREIDPDTRYRILAVGLALFGANPFSHGPLASALARAGIPLEPRAVPWLKFQGVNSNHLGLMFSAVALLAILRAAGAETPRRSVYVLAGISMLGSALLYPMSFLTNGVWLVAAAAWLAFRKGRPGRARAFGLLAAATLGTLPALPYLWQTGTGRSAAGALQVAPTLGYVLRQLEIVSVALALPLLLIALSWRRLKDDQGAVLALCAAAALAVYSFAFITPLVAYKFLMASLMPLGLLAALPLRRLWEERPLPALACLLVLFLPFGMRMGSAVVDGWPAAQPLTHRGAYLEPLDPAERDLCRWIADNTPKDALFVDDRLTVPPFGRRQLFVALSQPAPSSRAGTHDGWGMSTDLILGEVTGADPAKVARRRRLAEELLGGTIGVSVGVSAGVSVGVPAGVSKETLDGLAAEARGVPVYVIARGEGIAARMSAASRLRLIYRGSAARVFQLVREPARSSR